jgi:hypothetical protein
MGRKTAIIAAMGFLPLAVANVALSGPKSRHNRCQRKTSFYHAIRQASEANAIIRFDVTVRDGGQDVTTSYDPVEFALWFGPRLRRFLF